MDPAWRSLVWETFEKNFNKDLISDCVLVVGESKALCVCGGGGVYQHICVYAFITFIYGMVCIVCLNINMYNCACNIIILLLALFEG